MAKDLESTMKWKVDISDLKAGMQEAKRSISQANAEFKKSTSGMDKWSKSTDGVKAKITQLKTVLQNQTSILAQLQKQYDITAKEMGEDSAEAQKLKTQITNQQAAINKTVSSIKDYNSKLNNMEAEEKEANSATGKLTKEIEEQQKKVDRLKAAYKESLVGKNPEEAKKLKKELKNASDELSKSKSKMNDADRAADKLAGSLDKSADKAKQAAKGGFTVLKGALANLVSQGISKVTSAITENLDGAIERVDTLNAYKRTMENLGYATEDVADAQQKLKDGVQGLPTTLPQIVSMQKQYAALTGDLGKSTDLTLALNNATLAAGAGADEASRAAEHWYKIISAGKPELENWKEINSIMPAQMNQIAESLLGAGKKANDLRDAWKDGTVATDQVIDALIKLDSEGGGKLASFKQQAQDASGGIGTSLTNIKVAIQTQLANMIEAIGTDKIAAALAKVKEYVGVVGEYVTERIKEMIPKIKEIIKVVIDNKEKIIKALGLIAAAIATAFVVKKVFDFITALKGLINMFHTVITTIKSIILLNPWLALIAGVAALVAGIVLWIKKTDEAKRAEHQLTEEQKKQIDVINENAKAYDDLNTSRQEAMDGVVGEYNHLESLIDEYNAHVDANGKVQDSYKGRADFILGELAKAFGMEVDEIKKLIDENGKLGDAIKEVMELKRAEALLNANQDAYNTAIKEQTNAWKEYADAQRLVEDRTRSYNKALDEVNSYKEKGKPISRDARIALEEEEKALNEAREAAHKAKETWQGYNQTIQNYEGLGAAIQTKDAEKIANAMAAIRYNLLTTENADRASLERQKKDFETQLAAMKEAADKEGSGISDSMIEEMERMVRLAGDEVAKSEGIFLDEGKKDSDAYAKGLNSGKSKSNKAGGDVSKDGAKGAGSNGNLFSAAGKADSTSYNSGLLAGKSQAYQNGYSVASSATGGMGAVNPYPVGTKEHQEYAAGILAGRQKAYDSGKELSTQAKLGAAAVSIYESGRNTALGFIGGISSMLGNVWNIGFTLASKAVSGVKAGQKEGSPSKLTRQSGVFFGQGFLLGIQDMFKPVHTAGVNLANTTIDAMADALGIHSPSTVARDKIGKNIAQGVVDGLNTSQANTRKALNKQINDWWAQVGRLNNQKARTNNQTTKKNLQNQIDVVKKKIKDANNQLASLAKTYNSTLIENAQNRMSDLTKYDRITLEQQVTFWQKIVASLRKGQQGYSKAYSEATGELKLAKRAYNEYLVQKDNESVSNLQAYISRMNSLDRMSLKGEVTLWEKKIKTLKKGSQAYKDAEVELYQARKALKEQEAQKDTDSVSNLQSYISRMNSLDKMSLKTEVKLWEKKIKTLKKGTQAYQDAEVELYQARKAYQAAERAGNTQAVSDLQNKLNYLRDMDKLSAAQELDYWAKLLKTLKKGTQAYQDAEVALYQAKKNIKSTSEELAKTFTSSVGTIKTDLASSIAQLKETLANDIKGIKDTLSDNINAALDTYKQAVQSRKSELANAWGSLFSTIALSPKLTAGKLTENMQLQVDALKAYDKTMASLEKKLGANSDIVAELREQGVESLHTLQSLDEMTTSQLNNYVKLYEQRASIAGKRATVENSQLKKETDAEIAELKKTASEEIKTLQAQSNAEIKQLQTDAEKQIKELTVTFKTGLKELGIGVKASSKEVGNAITDGIKAGINEGMKDLTGSIKTQTQGLVNTVKKELKIKSPSRVFRDEIGAMLPPGIAQGFSIAMPDAERDMKDALTGAVKDLRQAVSDGASNIIPFNADGVSGGGTTNNQVVNFNQTINSPKAVDRLSLYRQTNSLLFGAKVRLSNV